jgi:hypothetical protein
MRVFHTVRSTALSFNLKYSVFSLKSLIASYVFFLVFSSLLLFTFLLLLHVRHSFPPSLYLILAYFWHDSSNCSSPFSSSTIFQINSGNSDLLNEVSKFQHHKKLCFKYSALLVCFLCLNPFWWQKILHLFNAALTFREYALRSFLFCLLFCLLTSLLSSLLACPQWFKHSKLLSYTCKMAVDFIARFLQNRLAGIIDLNRENNRAVASRWCVLQTLPNK